MAAVHRTPLPDSWGEHWEGLSDNDSAGLQMVGELGGAMAVSTILSRATSRDAADCLDPWELPLADAAAELLAATAEVLRAGRAREPGVVEAHERTKAAAAAMEAIMAPRRARLHRPAEELAEAARVVLSPAREAAGRPAVPESVIEEAALESGEIIGSRGGDWLNRYDAVLSVFVDAGAYLAADEACELFVIMQDFMNGYFDRYRASASRWQRRRCARRVNDALSRMRAFAERNPQMVN